MNIRSSSVFQTSVEGGALGAEFSGPNIASDFAKTLKTRSSVLSCPLERQIPLEAGHAAEPFFWLAVFSATLFRHSNQSDFLVALSVLGDSLSTELLSVSIEQETPIAKILDDARSVTADVRSAFFERDPNHLVADFLYLSPEGTVDRAEIESVANELQSDFLWYLNPSSGALGVFYNPKIFREETVEKIIDRAFLLAKQFESLPASTISSIPVLTKEDEQQLKIFSNTGTTDFPEIPLIRHVENNAEEFPDKRALIHKGASISYKELNVRANQLAHLLSNKGCGLGSKIGVFVVPSFDICIALLAIHKIGAIYVPLDPTVPQARLSVILSDVEADVIVTNTATAGAGKFDDYELVVIDELSQELRALPTNNPAVEISLDDIAYIYYTSGTTGKPKGVLSTHANLVNYILVAQKKYRFDSDDSFICCARYTFSISMLELLSPLVAGGELVIPTREEVMTPELLVDLLKDVTCVHIGPALMKSALAQIESANGTYESFHGLKHVSCGGDTTPPELLGRMQAVFARAEVYVIYGSSEIACMGATYKFETKKPATKAYVGKPFDNVELRLLDKQLNPVPAGTTGEVCFGGKGVTKGYLHRPELTAEKYIDLDGSRFYRTGDVGRFDQSGNLELLGREDFQVQINGVRIELGELEYYLKRIPGVKDAVAAAQMLGKGQESALIGYLVSDGSGDFDVGKIRDYLLEEVPEYMTPTAFVALDALPLNHNLKVDRKSLPQPDSSNLIKSSATALEPADDELMEALLQLLGDIDSSGEMAKDTSIDFSLLGMNSIGLMRIRNIVEKRFAVNITVHQLYNECSNLVSLAAYVSEHKAENIDSPQVEPAVDDSIFVDSVGDESDKRIGFGSDEHPGWFVLDEKGSAALVDGENTAQPVDYDPFKFGRLEAVVPLSEEQKEVWLSCAQNTSANRAYNLSFKLDFSLPVDTGLLEKALDVLVERHQTLRSFVHSASLSLCISADRRTDILKVDGGRQQEFTSSPFDLSQAPLFRVALVDDADQRSVLLCFHHIIMDGWSIELFVRQLVETYQALLSGSESIEIEYDSYVEHVQRTLPKHEENHTESLNYWKDKYRAAPDPLNLPTTFPRPAHRTYSAELFRTPLASNVPGAVFDAAARLNVSTFSIYYAAFLALVNRLTNQEDMTLGVPLAGQLLTGSEKLMTHNVKTLPLRHQVKKDQTFSHFAQQVSAQLTEATAHGFVSYGEVLPHVGVERSPDRPPLVSLVFTQDPTLPEISVESLSAKLVALPREYETFDLWVNISETANSVFVECQFNNAVYDSQAISRWFELYDALLSYAVRLPDDELVTFPLVSKQDIARLSQWNETKSSYGSDQCLHQLIERQVAESANSIAVSFDDCRYSYAELDQRANQLANFLVEQGVGPDVLVGICVERSAEMLVALLAVLKAGGGYLPLDPEYPRDRIEYILENAQAPLLISQDTLLTAMPSHAGVTISLDGDWEQISGFATDTPVTSVQPDNLAYVIYTSGSTGKPKGVQVTHGNVVNFLSSMQKQPGLTAEDKLLAVTTLSFDIAVLELYLPLITGAQVDIASREMALDAQALARRIEEQKISVLQATPATWRMLLDYGWQGDGSLKALVGGEALPRDILPGLVANTSELWNMYGPTETTVWSTCCPVTDADAPILIGKPIANTQLYVLDPQGQQVPVGVPGELYIGGDGVTRGYLNRPELNENAFIDDPYHERSGMRLYRTGDQVKLTASGDMQYISRLDSQVKVRGFRIELGEIEAVLSAHVALKQSVVVVREDQPGDVRLVGYYVLAEFAEAPSVQSLREHLQQSLPGYMVPQYLVLLESMPLTPNGKIDRKQLPEYREVNSTHGSFVAPSGDVERSMANLWKEVLSVEKVGAEDSFFELGGSSIQLMPLLRQMREEFATEISFSEVLLSPTVRSLASKVSGSQKINGRLFEEKIEGQRLKVGEDLSLAKPHSEAKLGRMADGCPAWFIEDPNREGEYLYIRHPGETGHRVGYNPFAQAEIQIVQPMTPEQSEVWFSSVAAADASLALNLCAFFDFDAVLDYKSIRRCILEFGERHDALRTTFYGKKQLACVSSSFNFEFPFVDWSELDSKDAELNFLELKQREVQMPFDLANGPLFRAFFVSLPANRSALLITFHHIVADRWSLDILCSELNETYEAKLEKRSPKLQPAFKLSIYNQLQNDFVSSSAYQELENYWVNKFTEAVPLLELPISKNRPVERTYRACLVKDTLPADLVEGITEFSSEHGCTFFSVVYSVYVAFLSRLAQQSDLVVGVPFAGQLSVGEPQLFGHLANMLPIRHKILRDDSVLTFLGRVAESVESAQQNGRFTFGELVGKVNIHRDPSRPPLVSNTFNFAREHSASSGIQYELVHSGYETFELAIHMVQREHLIEVFSSFNSDLFDSETMERWLSIYIEMLSVAILAPDTLISELPLLCLQDKVFLALSNETKSSYGSDQCLHQLIERQVAESANSIAVSFDDCRYSYAELDQRANQLANFLVEQGVGPDVLVGICVERSAEMLVALLAVLKAGGGYLPLDPEYPRDRIEYILENAQAPLLISQDTLLTAMPSHAGVTISLDGDWEQISGFATDTPVTSVQPDNLAYVIYTSGSTGKPKGVQVTHGNVVNFLSSMQKQPGLTAEDKLLAVTTLSFDIAVLELYLPLITGAQVDIASREMALDAQALARRIEEQKISVLQATPATWRMLLDYGWQGDGSLKALVGGEALPRDILPGLVANTSELWNMYGPTETTVWSTCCPVTDADAPILIGKPIANTQLYVLDPQGQQVPVGVPGELYIGGDGVTRGYLNRPELNENAFIDDPYHERSGMRLYRTGDQVKLTASGDMQYISRLDSQVKVRGFRIELGEIEAVLSAHVALKQSVVVVREDQPGDVRLVGYYVLAEFAEAPSVQSLREHLQQSLPGYMVPQYLVLLESMPLTPNGKIDRKQLPEPEKQVVDEESSLVDPRNDFERGILSVWKKLLNIPSMSITDDFFELGGHSLLAVKAITEMQRVTGVEFDVSLMFQHSTVQQLVEALGSGAEQKSSNVVLLNEASVAEDQKQPPLFLLCGVEIYRELASTITDRDVYGVYVFAELAIAQDAVEGKIGDVSFTALCDSYIEAISRIWPSGSVLLGGVSFGGFIAFEVTRKISERQILNVENVMLLDTWLPSAFSKSYWRYLLYAIRHPFDVLGKHYKRRLSKSAKSSIEIKESITDEERAIMLREKAFMDLMSRHEQFLVPTQNRVTVFKATENKVSPWIKDSDELGWGELAPSSLEVVPIPGDHLGILKEPNAKLIANSIAI